MFARGARGGHGVYVDSPGGHGALVRAVFKLQEGDTIFVLIGQPGTDACKQGNRPKVSPSERTLSRGQQ